MSSTPFDPSAAPPPQQPSSTPANGLGTASMVLGIVGVVLAFIPIIGVLAWPTVIVGLVLGIIALLRVRAGTATNKGQSITGIVLSGVGLGICLIWLVVLAAATGPTPLPQSSPAGGAGGVSVTEPQYPSREHENAYESAQSYLRSGHFSEAGLIDQLSSQYADQYPRDVAEWAVANVHADWNAEALEAAQSYLDSGSFSTSGLRDQLTSQYGEQFTPEQADFAITHLPR
ncbi:hypothetical protein EIL87_12775 [Saccharopolyspora rhizosphaerae]|uniref:Putative host cell surface-exposed lipoprotein Ltp-like HTH region domain-containing protein n=1 Tax=Saccharopolyspora rhizosphaerae TaxID=2492662 RepID=A0A426JU37_9PSEU|nr:Ltp family lipoprotein [Saccharopolyspora rhizosphaerae]RRO16688.1 hypothetical protein EIL87_12775 [Saccharopolyspora rhizosphaerae]